MDNCNVPTACECACTADVWGSRSFHGNGHLRGTQRTGQTSAFAGVTGSNKTLP